MKLVMIFVLFCALFVVKGDIICDPVPGTPTLTPMGVPRGIAPGRVGWSYKPEACTWNGSDDYYWSSNNLNQTIVDEIMFDIISMISNITNPKMSWIRIFEFYNERHGKKGGYQPGEKVAIKLNMNTEHAYDSPNNGNAISPQFVYSLFRHLVYFAGVPQEDAARWIPKEQYYDFFKDEFPNIRYEDNDGGESYVSKVQVDENYRSFQFSNTSIDGYNTTYFPTVTTQSDYLISLGFVRGHDLAGFTASGKNWFGNIYNPINTCDFGSYVPGSWCPKFLHEYISVSKNPMGSYSPLVDLLGEDMLGDHCLLFLMDGMYSGPAEHQWMDPIKYTISPFNNNWMCSGFASLDPVALDSVVFDFISNEPNQPYTHKGCIDNYLHEAALANDPPSGTKYMPNMKTQLSSLGVHEHWNSVDEKKYSKNLGIGDGIELISSLDFLEKL